jgi:hypothetical protein
MGIRDEEISRLISYAKGLGLKVTFNSSMEDSGGWTTDGTELIISTHPKNFTSKTEMILTLIHEIAHMVHFIHEKNRNPDLKFEEALERQNLYEEEILETPAPKRFRNKILQNEVAATKWWTVIYQDTNIKIPLWKVNAAMEFDIYQYQVYYETGHFPTKKQRSEKNKEINLKYKPKRNII